MSDSGRIRRVYKIKFWEVSEALIQRVPLRGKISLDLSGHVGNILEDLRVHT